MSILMMKSSCPTFSRERIYQTDAAVNVHLDEWINLIEQGKTSTRLRAYAEALIVIAKLERGTAQLKNI